MNTMSITPTTRRAPTTHRTWGPARSLAWAAVLGVACATASAQPGERQSPVFFDDSTAARETLATLDRLVASGNELEAVRALQRLLDDEPESLVSRDEVVFNTVRDRVHEILLDSPALLERYREIAEPAAASLLASGRHADAERARLLTPSGYEATLRVAQSALESARFGSARRTLAQLEAHPDRRRRTPGADAARLAHAIAQYTDADADWALADRWAREAGAPEPGRSAWDRPAPEREAPVSSVEGVGPARADVAGVVGRPLRSVPLTEPTASLGDQDPREVAGQYQTIAWTLPAAAGDVLYTNDGLSVSAYDRFTLHPLWRVRTTVDPTQEGRYTPTSRRRLGRILEDASSVTVSGDLVLATTGVATPARRDGDARLHAIARDDGTVRWSIDVAQLHPDLTRSTIRGPAQVDGSTVVVAARKSVPNRRLVSVYLVGLDLGSGEMLWHRMIATAGSLPFQQYNRVPQAGAIADGVVYRIDEMGVAAAVEAHSGRPLWARRLPAGDPLANARIPPWNTSAPIVVGEELVCIGPSRASLLVIDRATGALTAQRPLGDIRDPNYLLRVGDSIACIGEDQIAFVDADAAATGPVRTVPRIPKPGVRGRVAVAGGKLIVPVDDGVRSGVMIVDPSAPRDSDFVELRHTGNVLALPGQIVAIDDTSAHSYLAWESASAMLAGQIAERPRHAGPAITLAELAWHAGREERIAPAVASALSALERAPDPAARLRLFNVVRAMLVVALDPVDLEGVPITDRAVLASLTEALGTLADTPEQRVAHLMLEGRLHESAESPALAMAAYQRMLTTPELAGASWRGAHLEVRAELEATRRAARLVQQHGYGVYAPFSAAAADAAGELASHDRSSAAKIAAAYPYASVTPGLWLSAGDELIDEGRPFAALRAWRAGLGAAETIENAGGTPDFEAAAELVGRLVGALANQGRLSEIAPTMTAARGTFGTAFVPTDRGVPIDVDALLRAHGRLAGGRHERALIGTHPRVAASPELLPGTVIEPVRRLGERAFARALLVSGPRRELVSVAAGADGVVTPRWARPITETVVPLVLEDADDRVVLVWPASARGGARAESLDQATGDTAWTSATLDNALPNTPPPMPGERMILPGGGDVALSEIVVASDERSACLVERTGRVASYDLRDGSTAWSGTLEVKRVADAVLAEGVLVVGGLDRAPAGADAEPGDQPASLVVAHDAATGQRLQRLDGIGGRVRWVRATRGGDVIVGTDRAVTSVNLVEGRVNWTAAEADTAGTLDAWVFGDRLVLLTVDRAIASVSIATGRPDPDQFDVRRRITGDTATRAHALGDRLVLASARGIVVLGLRGELLGVDALDTDTGLVPAAAGQGVLVTFEPKPLRRPGQPSGELHLLSAESGRLLSSAPIRVPEGVDPVPRSVSLMDGRVLLGYAGVTMVVEVPTGTEGG